jgi:hypothetical protein
MNILKTIFGSGTKSIVDSVGGVLDNLITNKEELAAAKLEAEKEINRHIESLEQNATRQLELVLTDKDSAREMFKANNSLQKIYALSFLLAYVGIIAALFYISFTKPDLPEFSVMLLSSIFGSMTTKVGTITDFLFGAGISQNQNQEKK